MVWGQEERQQRFGGGEVQKVEPATLLKFIQKKVLAFLINSNGAGRFPKEGSQGICIGWNEECLDNSKTS